MSIGSRATTDEAALINHIKQRGIGVYWVIGTLEQAQYLVKEKLGLEPKVHIEPAANEIAGLIELVDPWGPANEALIIAVDPKVIAKLSFNPKEVSKWVFLCTNELTTDEPYPKLEKVSDLKTKAVTSALKKHTQLVQIDLRKVALTEAHNNALLKQYYLRQPYTAERMSAYSGSEIQQIWAWHDEYTGATELLSRLLTVEGVLSWGRLSYVEYLMLKGAYERFTRDEKLAPIGIKTTSLFINPFLQLASNKYETAWSYPLSMFGSWVYFSTHSWAVPYGNGLQIRRSQKGFNYLSFSASPQAVNEWSKTLALIS